MFLDAYQFNQDISMWNTENVNDMSDMFNGCWYFNQDIGGKVVTTVIANGDIGVKQDSSEPLGSEEIACNLNKDCENGVFIGNSVSHYNSWATSNVTNMSGMFFHARDFNNNLNSWDVSKVTDMSHMFEDASSFNKPLNKWDISNVDNFFRMFWDNRSFQQYIGDWCLDNDKDQLFTYKDFNEHNSRYQFTKERLIQFMHEYNNNSNDKNKYELIKYCRQFSQNNKELFTNIVFSLDDNGNILKNIFDFEK
jgi:surface protein